MACLIAAPCSGSGKTLVSLALSALVRRRGQTIQTFGHRLTRAQCHVLGAGINLDAGDHALALQQHWKGRAIG